MLYCWLQLAAHLSAHGQSSQPSVAQRAKLTELINQYSLARENSDTALLKKILRPDIDQLVSTGEWRAGLPAAVEGMLKSSSINNGKRTLTIDKIRMTGTTSAVVDCRYEIVNADGSVRKMWSSFIAVREKKKWKIAAIRNMLPSSP
jgi:hypothetical protein